MNPFGSLARAGVVLAFGSDSPITPLDPWAGVRAAAFHHEVDERMTVRAAFNAHTRGGHRARGDDEAGVLQPGAAADLCGLGPELGTRRADTGRQSRLMVDRCPSWRARPSRRQPRRRAAHAARRPSSKAAPVLRPKYETIRCRLCRTRATGLVDPINDLASTSQRVSDDTPMIEGKSSRKSL